MGPSATLMDSVREECTLVDQVGPEDYISGLS